MRERCPPYPESGHLPSFYFAKVKMKKTSGATNMTTEMTEDSAASGRYLFAAASAIAAIANAGPNMPSASVAG